MELQPITTIRLIFCCRRAEHTGLTKARLLLAENQFLYLGEGKRCGYGMICYLGQPFPVTDVYFRLLL